MQSVDQEEVLAIGKHDDSSIDECLAALEDIIFSQEFSEFQDAFLDRHCHRFEDTEENYLFYTEIFNEYGKFLDEYLSKYLQTKLPLFNFTTFATWLLNHEDEIAGDIVELIHSTTDFLHFKSMMLEHKMRLQDLEKDKNDNDHKCKLLMSNGGNDIDLGQSLSIRSCKLHLQ